ncbi:hypothetical protein [Sphingobacterium daejeonense]|uniref:hypothetical protein n=1 Tax=Sphingobacterium daejeonense TaxID=371142 RepID=UPI0010FDEFDE|nr:hypothetical protein [Sphingobacterium daejeonense]
MGHPEKQLIFEHKKQEHHEHHKKNIRPLPIGTGRDRDRIFDECVHRKQQIERQVGWKKSTSIPPVGNIHISPVPMTQTTAEKTARTPVLGRELKKPGSVPSTFSASQAADLKAQGLIVEMDAKKGVYIP